MAPRTHGEKLTITESESRANPEILKKLNDEVFKVAIYGSARILPEDPRYQEVYKLAREIALNGWDVVNGGGPGIMQAASEGHSSVCEESPNVDTIGLNIVLPHEQKENPYLNVINTHESFSTRLDEFVLLSDIFVVAPGGIGTCLELFYSWQLMQVNHICRVPIIVMGDMWKHLLSWVRNSVLKNEFISESDLDLIICVDNYQEAMEALQHAYKHYEQAGPNACINIHQYSDAMKRLGYVQ